MGRPKGSKSTFGAVQTAQPKNYAGPQGFRMAPADPACKKCDYFDGRICDYMAVTGIPRILVSPPPPGIPAGKLGKFCKVREVTGKRKSGPRALRLSPKQKRKKAEDDTSSTSGQITGA